MSEIFTNILTKIGQQKKAQAEAPNGTVLNITTFKVGDSNGAYYQPNENQTALVNVKYSGNFIAGTQSQIVVNPLNSNEVLYKCFIPADVGGFTIRELGLFDSDGDLILICKLPAQDKFALASGLYQPLTFTPKIIYTNPQTEAVLTPISQIVPTTSEVIDMITEYAPQSEFSIPLKNTNGTVSLDFDETLKILDDKLSVEISNFVKKDGSVDFTAEQKGVTPTSSNGLATKGYIDNAIPNLATKFAINFGNVDSSGNADLLSYSGTTLSFKVGGSYSNLALTYADKAQEILTNLLNITGLSTNGTFQIIKEKSSSIAQAVSIPVYEKDLYSDFSQGNANDNYGLHIPTSIGSPTYTNNKFNSNGTTGLNYPISTFGNDAWCIQSKFKLGAVGTAKTLFQRLLTASLPTLEMTTANKLALSASSNNSSNDIGNGVLGTKSDWGTSIEYYIRCRFTGTQYLVDWSTDYNPITGIGTWTNDIAINSSTSIYNGIANLYFGISAASTVPWNGTMDDLQVTIGNSTCLRRNQVTQGKAFPLYPIDGDYHCLTSPDLKTYKRISDSWVETQYVILGAVTVSNGVITSVFTTRYNQNGYDRPFEYYSGDVDINLSALTMLNHNLGGIPQFTDVFIKCVVAENGYSVGDCTKPMSYSDNYYERSGLIFNEMQIGYRPGNGTSKIVTVRKDTGGQASITAANWKYNFIAKRWSI